MERVEQLEVCVRRVERMERVELHADLVEREAGDIYMQLLVGSCA